MFKKMRKCDDDLRQHNMVLSNYEGKTSNILGVIQVDLAVGTTIQSTLFMVINSEVDQSYNRIDEAKGSKKSFDQHLENIAPCDDESGSTL